MRRLARVDAKLGRLDCVTSIPISGIAAIALGLALGCADAGDTRRSAKEQNVSATMSSKRMADGKEWTTANLNVNASPSYCYSDSELNCRRYGRLYTWAAASRACETLGGGWRLPTDDEWRRAPFYNFGKGGQALHRQPMGDKQMAISVRCVRE